MTVTQAGAFTSPQFTGQINAGVTVKYGLADVNQFLYSSALTSTFQMNGGTFELDAASGCYLPDNGLSQTGTLIANAGLNTDQRETVQIQYGQSGKAWARA